MPTSGRTPPTTALRTRPFVPVEALIPLAEAFARDVRRRLREELPRLIREAEARIVAEELEKLHERLRPLECEGSA